jgi:hypothetical protein
MLPKVASALARALDPIQPIERPGQSVRFRKTAEGNEGGYGSPGYESPSEGPPEEKATHSSESSSPLPEFLPEEGLDPKSGEKPAPVVPFRPGLTQVILDLNASRPERSAGTAALTYETGAKAQKKNARLPKGSMLDKKAG